jgi:predicted DNA-binding protein
MISENNTRVLVTMPKETKEKLEKLAKEDNRSVNNLILTVINKYINNQP